MDVVVAGFTVQVERHAIGDTSIGLAGFFSAKLPDGRSVLAVGRWDRSDILEHDEPWCDERVWIDGELTESGIEGSLFVWLVPESGTVQQNGLSVEEVALAIHLSVDVEAVSTRPAGPWTGPPGFTPARAREHAALAGEME